MIELASLVAGEPVDSAARLPVTNPYNGDVVGAISQAGRDDVERAITTALDNPCTLTRFERSEILDKTRRGLEARRDEFAELITREAGLCLRESRYEVGRAADVLKFAAIEALRDDGQIFSCDVSANGKQRKIFTTREPLSLAVAITPFNHPLNQVTHKVAPAIAAGTPMILKPSEKTPLTALKFAGLLLECGLPGSMLSVLLGPTEEVAKPLVTDPRAEVVMFTGSVAVGKMVAATAGYKRTVLELGGNDPLIVLANADLDLAARLACEGSFRNSGQRCTAVKRILVAKPVREEFTRRFVVLAQEYSCGDPMNDEVRVGTVIDEPAAEYLESVVREAVEQGARVIHGGRREGAQMHPTIIADVPRDCRMVTCESFGPLAPIMEVEDLEDAITLANATPYGLSSSVVTNSLSDAMTAIRRLKMGTVNINEVPGFRLESSPFGGIKDSGLGIKEGVIEAMKSLSYVKTFSLPW